MSVLIGQMMARGIILIIKNLNIFIQIVLISCMDHTECPHGGIVVYSIFLHQKSYSDMKICRLEIL